MAASRIGLLFTVILIVMVLAALAGCGFTLSSTAYQTPVPLRGSVRGGNQPVSGASVQFYAAGTSGPGSAALPLLGKPVQSDSNGNFSIPASLICPSSTSQVYVVARGGKPGTLSGAGNPALELTAMLGSCNDLSTYSSIFVNEVTTVGSVWPLAAFMTSASHLGYAPGDASFLNAVSSVPEFINIAQGNSPGKQTATSYFAENSKLYSLANLLADCVNSSGGSAGDGSPCGLLFSIATVPGANAPTDTATAAIRIAQNPHNNVLNIFGLTKADTSYQPTLTSAPPDWTLTLTYLVATPTISLATGSYAGTQEVTISDSTPGSAIHYTTDGTVPTSSSPLYAGALSITVSSTVQAIAVLEGSQSAIASSMLTINSAHAPAKLGFVQQPSNALTGATISPAVQVAVEDSSGNVVTTATDPVTLSLTGGTSLAGTLTATPRNGIATFGNLTVDIAGAGYTLSASSPGLVSATSGSFSISAAAGGPGHPPAKLAFLQQPSNALTGAAISPAVQVVVEDSSGNVATTATNPVTVTLISSAGPGGGRWTATPQKGIATFSNLTVSAAGSGYTLVATSPSLTSTTSSSFTISAPAGIAPSPAELTFLQQPSNGLIGATISPAVQVAVEDTSGNMVPGATDPITIALMGGSGLAGTLTATPLNGIATFSNLSVSAAGNGYTLVASSPGLASTTSASFSINAPGGGNAASPVKLAFLQYPSNAMAGAAISPAVQVAVEDSSGNAVSAATNKVTLSLLGGGGLAGTLTVMPQNGVATFSNLSIAHSGSGYQLEATSPGLTAAVSGTFAIGTSTGVSVAIAPNNINLSEAQGESFVATVSNTSNTAVTWSISPLVGTMSNGYYAPPASITTDQTVTVTATSVADPTKTATATIVLDSPSATSSSTVQSLGAIPATQPLSGLGFNIDPTEWEFKLAAAAGTTHVRFQCGWINNESQTPPPLNQNTSTKYLLQPACQTALALSKQYGMHPTIIAGYGAPYHAILNVSVPGGAASGSKSINIQFASGVGGDTLQSLAPFYDTIIGPNNTQITSRNSYAGALVTAVTRTDATHATLTLASALTSALPANTTTNYTINEYLHPPAATSSPTDPSVLAFANYAEFLAQSIASAGLTGEVEIWNEPVWTPDPWDDRVNFYDTFPGVTPPGPQAQGIPNYGFAAALQAQASPCRGCDLHLGWNQQVRRQFPTRPRHARQHRRLL
jgi:hypothetical protein